MIGPGRIQTAPWLSVIVPTFNGAATVGEALASISSQDDSGVEVLVVDDGSTDATLQVVSSYEHRLNLRIFPRDHTGNWVANTNRGIEASSGAYLSLLHQDDRWEHDRLSTVRRVLAQNPGVKMCFHPSFFIGPDSVVVGLWRCPFATRGGTEVIPPDIFVRRLLVQNFIAIPAPVFAKTDALAVGMLDESLPYTADWDFWLKLAGRGPSAYLPKPLASFRVHGRSQTDVLAQDAPYMERQLFCVLNRHFDRFEATARSKRKLFRIASFSAKTNVAFMRCAHAEQVRWLRLFVEFLGLGPRGWGEFFRCSRIGERTLARLRVRKHAPWDNELPRARRRRSE